MVRVGLVGLFAALLGLAGTAQHSTIVYGRGNDSCRAWLKSSESNRPTFNAWIHGYATAASQAMGPRLAYVNDPSRLSAFVTRYCEAHPTETVFEAATNMMDALMRK